MCSKSETSSSSQDNIRVEQQDIIIENIEKKRSSFPHFRASIRSNKQGLTLFITWEG